MLHDYAHSEEEYQNVMVDLDWQSPSESHYLNIIQSIKTNGLDPWNYDLFKSVLWGSFVKQ
jgi:hypothetical protein